MSTNVTVTVNRFFPTTMKRKNDQNLDRLLSEENLSTWLKTLCQSTYSSSNSDYSFLITSSLPTSGDATIECVLDGRYLSFNVNVDTLKSESVQAGSYYVVQVDNKSVDTAFQLISDRDENWSSHSDSRKLKIFTVTEHEGPQLATDSYLSRSIDGGVID